QGEGVSGREVTFVVQGAAKAAAPCGAGCYRALVHVTGRPASVRVDVSATRWQVALPSAWPPRDARALLTRAGRVWRSLRSLGFSESLASDARHGTTSTWLVQAPDRLSYRVKDGWSGIVVGASRWDRSP